MSSESSSHPEEAEPAQEIVTLAGEEVLDEGEESEGGSEGRNSEDPGDLI